MSDLRSGYLVGRADRILRSQLEQMLASTPLTVPELTTLSVLRSAPGQSNAKLARRSLVTPQAMHKVIVSLEKNGYVTRTSTGGRNLGAEITDAGRAVLAEVEPKVTEIEDEFFGVLTTEERAAFEKSLAALARISPARR